MSTTYLAVCTAIADHMKTTRGLNLDPVKDIFEASPSGELWQVHEGYWLCRSEGMQRVEGFEPEAVAELPLAPVAGQIVSLTDGSVHVWLGYGWQPMGKPPRDLLLRQT